MGKSAAIRRTASRSTSIKTPTAATAAATRPRRFERDIQLTAYGSSRTRRGIYELRQAPWLSKRVMAGSIPRSAPYRPRFSASSAFRRRAIYFSFSAARHCAAPELAEGAFNARDDLRILLIGPVILGLAHLAGSKLLSETTQIVGKRPAAVYSNLSKVIAVSPLSGTMEFEGGKSVPYRVRVDRTPGERIVLHLLLGGREAGQVDVAFTPENGGEATRMTAKVEGDGEVIREELAGTDKAKLGYAPDWMLTFAFRRTLRDLAEQIEQDELMAQQADSFMGGGGD